MSFFIAFGLENYKEEIVGLYHLLQFADKKTEAQKS